MPATAGANGAVSLLHYHRAKFKTAPGVAVSKISQLAGLAESGAMTTLLPIGGIRGPHVVMFAKVAAEKK